MPAATGSRAEAPAAHPAGPETHWYFRQGTIIATLVFFPPVGIPLAWKAAPWTQRTKVIAILSSLGFFIYAQAVHGGWSSGSLLPQVAQQAEAPPQSAVAPPPPVAPAARRDLAPRYDVLTEERLDIAAYRGRPAVPRVSARITVPAGLTRGELTSQLEHAVRTVAVRASAKGVRLGAAGVFAYREEDDTEGVHSAGKADFAPGGRWGSADPSVPMADWRVQVEVAEGYFRPIAGALAQGADVRLVAKGGGEVALYDDLWTIGHTAQKVASVPAGSVATVLEVKSDGGLGVTVAHVEVGGGASAKRGWVYSSQVASDAR